MRLPFMFAFVGAVLLLAAHLSGCVVVPPLPHRDPTASWDQANLKANDHGCPTAVFVAPGGNLTQCALADKLAAPKDDLKFFPTADEAALYVVSKIYENSHYYEYGGVILKSPKGYFVSAPITQRHGLDVMFDEDPETYPSPIAASYHVHLCLSGVIPSVFSPQDLAGARSNNHPAYVLDECTGALHYWVPGDGYLDAAGLLELGINPIAHSIKISAGKIVGKIVVDGVLLN